MTTVRKVWGILTRSQRLAAGWLAVLMTVGMLLEMLGVGLVVPAMAALSGGRSAADSATLARIRGWLGNPDDIQLVVIGLVALLVIYAVKAVFLVYLAWRQGAFVADLQCSVSNRLFAIYLNQPWTFHLQRNSATLIHRVTTDAVQVATLASSLLLFSTELFVIVGISTLLVVLEPAGAVGAAVALGAATWIFQHLTRRRIDSWGVRQHDHAVLRNKHLHQGLGAAKDVRVLGRENYFLEQFSRDEMISARMRSRLMAAQQVPRLWYELLAVTGLAVIGMVLIWQGNSGPRLIARLGLFAAAAFRLMPSANRMLLTWQSLRFGKPSIDAIHEELSLEAAAPAGAGPIIPFDRMLELSDVSYRYPGATSNALDGVRIKLAKGRSLGVVGGSGAGKSTLVDVILGLLEPDSGAVLVDGRDIRTNIRSWQDRVGYVPQSIYLTDDTIAANVAFGIPPNEVDPEAVRRAIKAAQLESFVAGLPQGAATFVGERGVRLSGGQRQRIGIARALYRDPPLLVLDEATSALDTDTERGVMEAVNELHGAKTLVIVAHRLTTVAQCDELIRLEGGRVVREGTFADVTASTDSPG